MTQLDWNGIEAVLDTVGTVVVICYFIWGCTR